ncbi:type II secretion system protein GspD [candidate division KSB3 bacterium]|uniref:Type II secretion system protein GspD n=1 Tax=candidate division KSB3 bacterium TaxID=2044937 RepID=A0A2G6EBJ7_9BACT|nr:MAG: type II secretion system protein GspD [candidate division KSB3 bacterium]PIE30687.1 MAG: type II secretion system protein GspD [candidate division KSB3 bacterium]
MLRRFVGIYGLSLLVLFGCAVPPQPEKTTETSSREAIQSGRDSAGGEERIEVKKIDELLGMNPDKTTSGTDQEAIPQSSQKTPERDHSTQSDLDSPLPGALFQTTVFPERSASSIDMPGVGLNFDNADIYDVTKVISEITKKSFIIDKDVTGTVTIFSENPMTPDQVFELFRTVLELNGLAIVQVGDFYKISLRENAQQRYLSEDPGTVLQNDDRLVTRVIKLKHIHGDAVKRALKVLMPKGKELVVYPDEDGDTLIVTDLFSNVNKILAMIKELDVSRYADRYLDIIPVHHADLADLVSDLSTILAVRNESPVVNEAIPEGEAPSAAAQTTDTPTAPESPQTTPSHIVPPGTRTRIYPITRMNSLVVSTNEPEVITLVRKWVDILDQPENTVTEESSSERQNFVYPVQYATAETLTPVLAKVYGEAGQEAINTLSTDETSGETVPVIVPQADDLASLRDDEEPPPIFIADTQNNAIIIQASPRQYAEVLTLLEKLDKRPLQVLIDVVVAEVQLNDSDVFGVQGMMLGQGQLTTGRETNSVETTTETVFNNVIPINSEGFQFVAAAPGRFLMQLRALATENRLKILSDPHILVRHNEEATINVGDDIPISETTGSGDNIRQNINYRQTGINLTVTPLINNAGDVVMNIQQEVSDVGQESFGDTGAASFTTRKTTTSVVTQDNRPLVMGGLMSNRNVTSRQGVPLLKDIPWLGKLFRYDEQQHRKVELIILVTPRVVKDPDEGWTLTENVLTDRIKRLEEFFNREETDADKIKRYLKN